MSITFHMKQENITPRLLMDVGLITINWAMIDNEITKMVWPFWFDKRQGEKMPRAFDKRIEHLRAFVTELYKTRDPEELRIFNWYAQRLKDANGLRDCIAHGMPGTVTRGSRTFEGLMVPKPSHPTKYIPMTSRAISRLAVRLGELLYESLFVGHAVIQARNATLPNARFWQNRDGLMVLLTWENRDQKLPRDHPPPSTFRG